MPDLESVLQEVRKGIGAIVDSEGKPIKTEEVEGAIVYLLSFNGFAFAVHD